MDKILVLDFGGQYNQLIARRVREQHVYAEIRAFHSVSVEELHVGGYRGIIFTGGPNSVYDAASPHYSPEVLSLGIPVLGICYGAQLMAYMAGGTVECAGSAGEYGKTALTADLSAPLFRDIPAESTVWMSHTDYISVPPAGFEVIARTPSCPCAAMCSVRQRLYAVQFHPEVSHTVFGITMLRNFLFDICGCTADWNMEDFIDRTVGEYRRRLAGQEVILALSG